MPIGTSGSALVVIVGPPSLVGTRSDVTNYGRAKSCRLAESSPLVMGGNCIADRSPRACVSTAADIAPRAARGSCHDAALECVLCGHPRFGRDQTGRAGLSGCCAHGAADRSCVLLAGIRHEPHIGLQTTPYPRRSANTAFNPPNANEFD